jgi:hypothetical protein
MLFRLRRLQLQLPSFTTDIKKGKQQLRANFYDFSLHRKKNLSKGSFLQPLRIKKKKRKYKETLNMSDRAIQYVTKHKMRKRKKPLSNYFRIWFNIVFSFTTF